VTLNTAKFEFRDFTQAPAQSGYDHQTVVATMHEQEVWFVAQFSVAKEKFRKADSAGK
jgi:hypothetical protein